MSEKNKLKTELDTEAKLDTMKKKKIFLLNFYHYIIILQI